MLNITSGQLDVVKMLLEHGADPLKTDNMKLNAMQWARYERHWDVDDFFVEKGYHADRVQINRFGSAYAPRTSIN